MAKLQFKTAGFEQRVVELKSGTNRVGRSPDCDVRIEHSTVSAAHCQVVLGCGEISVRDCGSTNGTYVDGALVQEASLTQGQTLRVGDLELLLIDTEVPVTIPRFNVPLVTGPPVIVGDGSVLCRKHSSSTSYRCQHCGELLCETCIHRLRRRGGKLLCLCPLCSFPVERIVPEKAKKKRLLHRLRETTRLLFSRVLAERARPRARQA